MEGERNRGRPGLTWKRETEEELKKIGKGWKELSRMAKEKTVEALRGSPMLRNGVKEKILTSPTHPFSIVTNV